MLTTIDNWSLTKAETAVETGLLPVRMVANLLRLDRQDDRILKAAFNEPTVDFFVKHGIIDWFHRTIFGETDEARANAVIGRPTHFQWETGLPVVYGVLTKAHPIVRDSILPHLEAGNDVFCASLGAKMLAGKTYFDPGLGRQVRDVSRMHWSSIAIAPRPHVMSNGSEVSLVKAGLFNDVRVSFHNLDDFLDHSGEIFAKAETLSKAMEAAVGITDSAQLTGTGALQVQSLEGANSLARRMLDLMHSGTLSPDKNGVLVFLKSEGYSDDEAAEFMRSFFGRLNRHN